MYERIKNLDYFSIQDNIEILDTKIKQSKYHMTFEEIADTLGISRSRVNQIYNGAISKLRKEHVCIRNQAKW